MIASLAALLACPLLAAADLTVFAGPPATPTTPAGPGDVVVLDPGGTGPARVPPGLASVVLLPVDFAGRVAVDELRDDRPRLSHPAGLPTSILLPDGRGSLHHFRRGVAPNQVFGFFFIDGNGDAFSVLERPATGGMGTEDPFVGRVSIAPDGGAFLVATSRAAGGDLIEVDLTSGTVELRTQGRAPRTFLPGGLCLATRWGFALSEEGPLRFDRTPGSQALFPGIARRVGPNVTRYEDGVVLSADESTMAFVGVVREGVSYVQLVAERGPIHAGCADPGPISAPGFLPDSTTGPHLALAPDGSCVAWRTEAQSAEAWVAAVPVVPQNTPPPALQITANQRFSDTLGETGVIGFLSPTVLTLVVGEPTGAKGGAGVGSADVYGLNLSTGALTNISGTSGDLQAPFLAKGSLDTANGLWQLPTARQMLAVEKTQGTSRLLTLDALSGTSSILVDAIKSIDTIGLAGTEVVLSARRQLAGIPTDLILADPTPGSVPILLGRLTKGCRFLTVEADASSVSGVLECGADRWIGTIDLPSLGTRVLSARPQPYGASIASLPGGEVAGTLSLPGGDAVFVWSPNGAVRSLYQGSTPVALLR